MSGKKKPNTVTKSRSKAKALKPKKGAWFVQTRWSYLPASPQAWALYAPYSLLLILVLLVASAQETVAEGVVIALPGLIALTVAFQWFAAHKS